MRKWLTLAIACSLSFGLLDCSKGPEHPKTPTAVVQALFVRIRQVKDATKRTRKEGSAEQAARDLVQSRIALHDLFLTPKKAKLIMMPLAFLDLKDVEFLEEKIDRDNAEVVVAHTVAGFGQQVKLRESAQSRTQVTFQLTKETGHWKISDIDGILAKYGR